MYSFKITTKEIDLLDSIKSFDLGIIQNNSIENNVMNISDYHFLNMYEILLEELNNNYNKELFNFISKLLKEDKNNIIKPVTI